MNASRRTAHIRDVEVTDRKGAVHTADVAVSPLAVAGEPAGVSITFTDVTRYKVLQETLQLTRQEGETAFEELQATYEELETTNEELQSTNEELETMNEELQSTNEELETINDELNLRTDELNQANAFLESVLRSLDAGVVVLDHELRVTAWNACAYELWGLRGDEVQGQHLMNLDIGLPLEQLMTPLRTVLNDGDGDGAVPPLVLEATNRRGRSFTCRVTVTPLNGVGGVHGLILLMETA